MTIIETIVHDHVPRKYSGHFINLKVFFYHFLFSSKRNRAPAGHCLEFNCKVAFFHPNRNSCLLSRYWNHRNHSHVAWWVYFHFIFKVRHSFFLLLFHEVKWSSLNKVRINSISNFFINRGCVIVELFWSLFFVFWDGEKTNSESLCVRKVLRGSERSLLIFYL